MLKQPPLGLYVHLPWCVSKCPYCDFNSHALKAALPEKQYLRALLDDLDREYALAPFSGIRTVFFGGGTPSLFGASTIRAVLDWLEVRGLVDSQAEVTLEVNPGTVERGSFEAYRDAGVNRVSLGVQSFSDRALRALGRIHRASEAWGAIEEIKAAAVADFNIDLMFGLPGQSPDEAVQDARRAISAAPTHVSHYQLTLEPNTLFHTRPPPLPSEEDVWEGFQRCGELLASKGFRRYEVSAYAKPGGECRHNLNYWRYGDYLGVGAGAHGKRTFVAENRIVRSRRTPHPEVFMRRQDWAVERADVTGTDRAFEFMLNSLRLVDGFDDSSFEAATSLDLGCVAGPLQRARDLGLIERTAAPGWRPTDHGQRFLNDLQAMFLPSSG